MRISWQLLDAVMADGFDAHKAEVHALLASAHRLRIAPMLCDVAGDDSAPASVRIRALRLILDDLSV